MLKKVLEKFKFTESNVPLALVVAGILAFGLQIPSLGFFQDDWHFIHYGSAGGARGMLEFLTMDGRPTAAWIYALGYPLLGFSPLPWHVLSLTLRLVTVILAWRVLQTLWPERTRANLIAAFFFLLYPFFTLQPQAVVYTEHWTSYALFAASMLLMLRAIEQPKRYLPYTALAIIATTLHLFTVEYFVGLELLRPLAIWLLLNRVVASERSPASEATPSTGRGLLPFDFAQDKRREEHPPRRNKLIFVAQLWLPYLLILFLFLYWRSAILGGLGLRNNPMDALSLQSIFTTAQNLGADIALVLVSSWFKLVDPAALELTRARNIFFLAITLLGGLAAYFYSRSFTEDTKHATRNTQHATRNYLLAATLAFLLGLVPSYAGNFVLHLKLEPWNGRFALAAMPGAAMLLALAFEWMFTSSQARRVMFAVLIGLLIGWHNRVAFDFKNSWDKQVKLYEQLTWRAPYIEPGTAIITDQEILSYMGDYPTSFAFNTIYDTKSFRPEPYWFFAMSENLGADAASLVEGVPLTARKYASTFVGNSRDSLIIDFEPEKNQCLWVLRPEDAAYRPLVAQLKTAAQVSNLSRIHDQPQTDYSLYRTIVPEERGTWCFHYERADLARQMGDWKQVIFFWDLAQKGGYTPGHGFEYIPFIQAYAHTGGWKQAFALTKQSNRTSESMKTILCPTWEELVASTPQSPERDSAVKDAKELLGCQ
jgi:hypothetical protein